MNNSTSSQSNLFMSMFFFLFFLGASPLENSEAASLLVLLSDTLTPKGLGLCGCCDLELEPELELEPKPKPEPAFPSIALPVPLPPARPRLEPGPLQQSEEPHTLEKLQQWCNNGQC